MEWISILKCPVTGSDLRRLDAEEVLVINERIADGILLQSNGSAMQNLLETGLINEDGTYIYPVINGISILWKDRAIVPSCNTSSRTGANADKQKVQNFYDKEGWVTDEKGNYEDAVLYEDLRAVSREYIKKCHDRVSRFLDPSGTYMLDAASGALQYTDYLQYSENYTYRVCVDFSFRALTEAKRKLGSRGIYILCDITSLPFKDNVMDGFVSLNTIYHIPKNEQVTAVKELYRTLGPGRKGVIVYDWYKHSLWMNFWMFPFRAFVFVKNRMLDSWGKAMGRKGAVRKLYFYAHTPEFFLKNLPPYQLKVWRSVSVHFMRYYIHSWLFGRQILQWIYRNEERNAEQCGLKGEYPLLVFEKGALSLAP